MAIHSVDCQRAQVLKAGYGPRIVATRWDSNGARFEAKVHIEGIDRHGILQELTSMISTHLGIDIRKLNIEASGEVFFADLTVKVVSAQAIADLVEKSLNISGVKSAARVI